MPTVRAAGRSLAYEWVGEGANGKPVLVFLHEGLGSIRQWRDFPAKLAATGCRGLVYDRYGYGQSEVLAEKRRTVRFMHDEALNALPGDAGRSEDPNPILVGHSDGASIALIHAGAGHPARGVVAMAPHVFIEPIRISSIRKATDLRAHRFRREAWPLPPRRAQDVLRLGRRVARPQFGGWDIRDEYLPGVRSPVLAIQGFDDEYGTMAQLDEIERRKRGVPAHQARQCGHAPFRDQPEIVLSEAEDSSGS